MSFQPDIESLFADHVKNADIVADINRADASMRMFSKAESIVFQTETARVVFIECNNREAFQSSFTSAAATARQHTPSINAAVAGNRHADNALNRISIKYTPTTEIFCALLSAWHYHGNIAHHDRDTCSRYEEEDFVLWGADDDAAPTEDKIETLPDCIFIDGIDKIASADSMPYIWALLNNTVDYINRARRSKDMAGCCRLFVGLVEDDDVDVDDVDDATT